MKKNITVYGLVLDYVCFKVVFKCSNDCERDMRQTSFSSFGTFL